MRELKTCHTFTARSVYVSCVLKYLPVCVGREERGEKVEWFERARVGPITQDLEKLAIGIV